METTKLKKFAQFARRSLIEQVSGKLKLVLAAESAARREHPAALKKLEEAIKQSDKQQVIERVAYIWFNRLCALRFMDVNRYNRVSIVSPADPGQFQPEILTEAKMGHIDDGMVPKKARQQIFALLDGKASSGDPQGEAYRLLVVAACNYWNKAMPFLFQRIDDYTELLMPDDLLSGSSILAYTREAMTPDACEDVEVIGWLYQFYISEKKDEVFADLKKNKKVIPENIPAATQLFTPHWIVRYLVENSLGRLWMLNRPGSKLIEQMDYYIRPKQPETDFLIISKPEEIKICDPACGSGHMLTYAFDLLYVIYEEEGYESAEIPEKILTNNLYGIEIDERAGELAAFALTMKARAKQRRFFSKGVKPNICVLENVHFDEDELNDYMEFVGRDLLTAPLQTTLRQFEEADNIGSLIRPEATDVDGIIRTLEVKDVSEQLFLSQTHQKVLQALGQADYLAPKYHVVIANPPYMGSRNMNGRLSTWLKDNFSNFKSDLFSAFMVRNTELSIADGYIGYMTPFTWLTLSSHEPVRRYLLRECTMMNLVKPSYTAFFDSAIVSVCAFSVRNGNANVNFDAAYFDLGYLGSSKVQAQRFLQGINGIEPYAARYRSREDFLSIPGAAFSFQMSKAHISSFRHFPRLGSWAPAKQGLATGKNDLFVRAWPEVSIRDVGFGYSDVSETESCDHKWFPYNKGGDYRRWYGNNDYVVDWESNGERIKSFGEETGKVRSRAQNTEYYFKPGVTWSFISSSNFGARYSAQGFIFDVAGSSVFPQSGLEKKLAGFMASSVAWSYLKLLNPTVNFQVGNIADLPVSPTLLESIDASISNSLIKFAKGDWDSGETSWDFKCFPLLNPDHRQPDLKTTYQNLRAHWQNITLEVQRLEEENNHIFIDAYGLQDELAPEVPLGEITLTCNPHYRYGGNKSEEELETLLLADTMRELVSYAVGCMFGRYALDKPGLILASQGETLADYLKQVPEPCFMPDADNAIPMMEGEWFADNINIRFREFLRITFGEKHFEGNLKFVEQALGKDLRKYFAKDFYGDHVKRYKKRPIYWLFSSPRGSFQVLIYMHRYRPDTVSVVLNDYLREFRTKLTSHKNHLEAVSISASSSPSEKTKALKEIEKTTKMIVEMEEYEREVLYPLATQQVEIDLDDGVKVNYPKLGAALKKIAGLEAKDD